MDRPRRPRLRRGEPREPRDGSRRRCCRPSRASTGTPVLVSSPSSIQSLSPSVFARRSTARHRLRLPPPRARSERPLDFGDGIPRNDEQARLRAEVALAVDRCLYGDDAALARAGSYESLGPGGAAPSLEELTRRAERAEATRRATLRDYNDLKDLIRRRSRTAGGALAAYLALAVSAEDSLAALVGLGAGLVYQEWMFRDVDAIRPPGWAPAGSTTSSESHVGGWMPAAAAGYDEGSDDPGTPKWLLDAQDAAEDLARSGPAGWIRGKLGVWMACCRHVANPRLSVLVALFVACGAWNAVAGAAVGDAGGLSPLSPEVEGCVLLGFGCWKFPFWSLLYDDYKPRVLSPAEVERARARGRPGVVDLGEDPDVGLSDRVKKLNW